MAPPRRIQLLPATILLALFPVGCRPPAAELKEAYKPAVSDAVSIDHSLLDAVLRAHVDAKGLVDYDKLHKDRTTLDAYNKQLASIEFEPLGRDEKLTVLINAYNSFTLALILDHYPLKSINDIPDADRWKAKRWQIGELKELSLHAIENEYLRSNFKEPRIHFAINCASIGCPPLRNEAYRSKDIEAQLEAQTRFMHNDKAWLDLDAENGTLKLTKLYDWYKGDFEQVSGTTLDYAKQFHAGLARLMEAKTPPSVSFLEYDWALNTAN